MEFQLLNTYRHPPQAKIHCVVARNLVNDENTADDKEAAGVNNQTHGTRQLCHPLGISLLEPPAIVTCTSLE